MTSKEEKKVHAAARVEITVELDLTSSWGHDCTTGQVFMQAARESAQQINNLFSKERARGRMRIVGEPKVTAVLAKERDN